MNTAQITYELEHDPKTSKKFAGCFGAKNFPRRSTGNRAGSSSTPTQAQNQGRIGLLYS